MTACERPEPAYDTSTTPVPTFFGARTGTVQDLAPGMVALAGLYCDYFGGVPPAARYAARQLRYWSAGSNSPLEYGSDKKVPVDIGDLKIFPLDPARTEQAIELQCADIVETGARLLVLGGDYSLSPALLAGALKARPEVSYGLLRLSGNMDLLPLDGRETDMPARRISTSRIARMLPRGLRGVALVGVRGLVTAEENNRAADTLLITAGQLHSDDASGPLDRLLHWARRFPAIFLSVDADVLAGAASENAALPASPGIPAETAIRILRSLHGVPVPIAHLAGHRPDFDLTGRTATETVAAIGFEAVQAMLSGDAPCR